MYIILQYVMCVMHDIYTHTHIYMYRYRCVVWYCVYIYSFIYIYLFIYVFVLTCICQGQELGHIHCSALQVGSTFRTKSAAWTRHRSSLDWWGGGMEGLPGPRVPVEKHGSACGATALFSCFQGSLTFFKVTFPVKRAVFPTSFRIASCYLRTPNWN